MRHHIGKNLAVLLREHKLQQIDLVRLTGIGQSTVSRIVSDELAVSPEQIQAIAEALKVSPEQLTLSSPVSQQDGHANNRSVHNGDSTDAKDEAIAALKSALAAKDALLAIKDEAIASKDALISQLQAQLGAA